MSLWVKDFIILLFQKPEIPSVVLSGLLIILQAFSLNSILIRSKALPQNTYLPAACYILMANASPEFLFASPQMMAVTFVLIGINNMFFHLQYRGSEENILGTGFVFGLSILFHPPSAIFIVLLYGIYIVYSSTLNRRYILITFGLLLPFIMVWVYFLWQHEGVLFWSQMGNQIFTSTEGWLVSLNDLLLLFGFPLLVALVSASQTFTGIGLTNHQIVIQRTMLFLGFFAIVSMLLNDQISTNSLIYLVPSISFFLAQFLVTSEKKWLGELVFALLFLWSIGFLILPALNGSLEIIDYSQLRP